MAGLLRRHLVALFLRVSWSVVSTLHRIVALLMLLVVALGWLVGLVSVKGKVAAMLTVERVDSGGENSDG